MASSNEHIIEAAGKTRVVVREGKVVSVGKPLIKSCPLASRFSLPVRNMTEREIQKNIENRIETFGMCTKDRQVTSDQDFVLFGASELLSSAIGAGILDCAVIACDGAGTVIADRQDLVQGIGGLMSGLVKTSPIPEVMDRIRENGGTVLFPESADMDSYEGTGVAYNLGYSRVAVTVASSEDAERIRHDFPEALIFGVHMTGITPEEARQIVSACDMVSSCASSPLRDIAGAVALLQGGTSIPVFALTTAGKEVMLEKIRQSPRQVVLKGASLPCSGKGAPEPLV